MLTTSDRYALARQVCLACFVGVLLALPAFAMCFDISGAGHGSNYAFYVFFAPEWLVWLLPPAKSGTSFAEVWMWVSGTLGLYGVYGGALAFGRSLRIGRWVFLAVLCIHYASFVWVTTGFPAADSFSTLGPMLAKYSIVHCVAMVELFIALHILAFQYARSTPPFRPRMTWRIAAALAVGLLAGVTLYVWGLAME